MSTPPAINPEDEGSNFPVGPAESPSPDEVAAQAHRDRIDALNKKLQHPDVNRRELSLEYTATADQIEHVERLALLAEADRKSPVPFGHPGFSDAKFAKAADLAVERNPPTPGFLASLIKSSVRLRAEAGEIARKAEDEHRRAIALQRQYDELRASLKTQRENFKHAQQARDSIAESLQAADDDLAIEQRFAGSSTTRSFSPAERAHHIDDGRLHMQAALADWPRVEKRFVTRITELEAKIADFEAEHL